MFFNHNFGRGGFDNEGCFETIYSIREVAEIVFNISFLIVFLVLMGSYSITIWSVFFYISYSS